MCSTTMHRCTVLRLDAVRCSHCTERLLFVRAAEYCSSTASINGSIDPERINPRTRAGAEQRASAINGLTTVVAAEHHAWQENARHEPGSRRTQVLSVRLLFAWVRRVDPWQGASRPVRSEPTATYLM